MGIVALVEVVEVAGEAAVEAAVVELVVLVERGEAVQVEEEETKGRTDETVKWHCKWSS